MDEISVDSSDEISDDSGGFIQSELLAMRSRLFQKVLAENTDALIGEIDQRIRGARKSGAIVSGARGLSAPVMTLTDGVQHILCLASRRVVDAEEVRAKLNSECKMVLHGSEKQEFADLAGVPFSRVVELIMMGDERFKEALSIEVEGNGNAALVTFPAQTARDPLFFTSNSVSHDVHAQWQHNVREVPLMTRCGQWFVFSCHYLRMYGRDIRNAA